MRNWSLSAVIALFLAMVVLAGCTTTTTTNGVATQAVDKQKALENRLQLALGYLSKGDRERARQNLEKAEEINSRSPEIQDIWALLYQQEMELGEAEAHFKRALSYDSNFTRGRNNYGMFLLRQQRYEEAYKQFVIGTEDLSYPKRGELFYKVGVTALKLNKPTEAEEAFKRALVLEPGLSQAYLELADLSFTQGDLSGSKLMLDKYNENRRRPTPRGLWLGVRLEHQLGNKDAEASQGLALRNLFPNSRENQEYQNWLNDEKHR